MGHLVEEPLPKAKSIAGMSGQEPSAFARSVVEEFALCGFKSARVTGWPGGDPKNEREAMRSYRALDGEVKRSGISAKAVKRGLRMYLVRTSQAGGRP